MSNPILDFVHQLAAEGLHPSTVNVELELDCQVRVELDDWCALGDGGNDTLSVDREGLPEGVTIKGRERFAARTMPLESPDRDTVDRWMQEVAKAGRAPDAVWLTSIHCLTKPIEWLREPLRSALIREQDNA